METVLISGATGFIGKNLIERFLLENKYKVIAYVLENDFNGIDFLKKNNVDYISSLDSSTIKNIDYCIHLASYGVSYTDRDIDTMLDVNVKFTARLVKFCSEKGCKLFINTGSCFEYGSLINDRLINEKDSLNPDDIYAASKVSCEKFIEVYCKILNLKLLTIRPFSIYGKYEKEFRLMPLLFEAGYYKKHISLTGGEQIRDYMDVKDVAFSIYKLIECHNKIGNINAINICSGHPLKLKDFIEYVINSCKFDNVYFGLGEKDYRANESMFFAGDNSLLLSIIGDYDFSISRKKIQDCFLEYLESKK